MADKQALVLLLALGVGACIVTPYGGTGSAPQVAPEPPPPPDEPTFKSAARSSAEQKLEPVAPATDAGPVDDAAGLETPAEGEPMIGE
jgi:hypothetical protein